MPVLVRRGGARVVHALPPGLDVLQGVQGGVVETERVRGAARATVQGLAGLRLQ